MSHEGATPTAPDVGRRLEVAIVGAGWAGLAAAIEAVDLGLRVTVYEMAPQFGGRARTTEHRGDRFDNGQHIMVGAYRDTFDMMRRVGVDLDRALLRLPLTLLDAQGRGLRLPPGPAMSAFVRGVLAARQWPWRTRLSLLRTAARWRLEGFVAPRSAAVADLLRGVPPSLVREFFDPLCVAALNTPSSQASAQVFLRVLRDALFSGPGSSDLVLPRWSLAQLLPEPGTRRLEALGARMHDRARVRAVELHEGRWRVRLDAAPERDGTFDAVILACSSTEAARLTQSSNPTWSRRAATIEHQAIVTVYAFHPQARLAHPMLTLRDDAERPAQFVFDYGHLDGKVGRLGFVVSGANAWLERGLDAVVAATLVQARELGAWATELRAEHAVAERRATFACVPTLDRPPTVVATGLFAAGDYVEGPYPATLEGAIRSAKRAVEAISPLRP